ncbi:F-type H+-transporting ATPase subunit epsilon [Seinonella peptonophila]|uniref:ATP synthase epsilon chain n=1 Tax=Seinonella peptonophila TaxID=112248 RepID=A0A1M4XUG8_9BACL|nr:F0F1 ATP synthase subunit epsilon [Seinonella peptonophila]SHE96986.1 F-type H+-transporting ATPase subunit epsilon [Seinonella peptonophila]
MQLDIVTPERRVYSEQVTMVIARAAEGDIGILPQHAPLVSPLKVTAVQIKTPKGEQRVAVGGGFIEVRPDHITILAESAELPDEIDLDRAVAAKKRAEERIEQKSISEDDLVRAKVALDRANVRIEVANWKS